MCIATIKKFFLWQLILTVFLSFYPHEIKASQKGASFFVATAAVLGVCKLYNMYQSYGPQGSEIKVRQYLEAQLQNKAETHNVNIPYASRIIHTGNTLKPYVFHDQIIDSAILLAEQENHTQLQVKHLTNALDIIEIGKKSNGDEFDEDFKRVLAIHESGHVIATILLLQDSYIVHKVMIGDFEKGSGVTMKLPLEGTFNSKRKKLTDFIDKQDRSKIIEKLAGGVTEQIFGLNLELSGKSLNDLKLYEGAKSDVFSAYHQARQVVTKKMPNQSFFIVFKMLTNSLSPEENEWIDTQAMKLLEDCYEETYTLIENNKDKIQILADKIMKDSIINEDDIYDVLNIDKPLYDFQEGPLPENLIKNYELRGYESEEKD